MHHSTFQNLQRAAALCGALLFSFPLHAATVLITQDVDLGSFAAANYDLRFSSATPVTVTNGSDIMITFNFRDGQRLLVNNTSSSDAWFSLGWPWLESKGASGDFTISNISITLLSPIVTGDAATTISLGQQSDGKVHLGPVAALDVGANSSISFTGITATYHVDSVPGGTNTYQPWLYGYFDALGVQIVGGRPVKTAQTLNTQMMVCYDQSSKFAASWSPPSEIVQGVPESVSTLLLVTFALAFLAIGNTRQRDAAGIA